MTDADAEVVIEKSQPGRLLWLMGPILLSLPLAFANLFLKNCLSLLSQIDPSSALLDFGVSPMTYLVMPLFATALLFCSLAPGLLLVLILARHRRSWEELILEGAGLSLFVACALSVLGNFGHGIAFRAGAYGVALGILLVVLFRRGGPQEAPGGTRKGLSWLLLPVLILATLSTPKIFWESVTGDGAHAFEATRLVIHRRSPFFSREAGSMSGYPGGNSVAAGFQSSLMMSFLGEDVAALRLGLFLNLMLLAAALRSLIPDVLRNAAWLNLLMWSALIATTSALAWSGGYDPYSADFALPASQDLLYLAFFLAAVSAWLKENHGRFLLFAFLTLAASPGGAFLLLTLPLARFLARGESAFKASLKLGLGIVAALLLHLAFVFLANRYWGMESGEEHGLRALLKKLRFLDFGDVQRFLWLIPGGIFPLAVFFQWRRIRPEARMLAISSLMAFFFFYLQLKTNLHYFCGAMVLPLAAFLSGLKEKPPVLTLASYFGLALVALYLAAPTSRGIVTVGREIGSTFDLSRVSGYEDCNSSAFQSMKLLSHSFPADHGPGVPEEFYGGSPLSWNYHARRRREAARTEFVVGSEESVAPSSFTEVHRELGYILWVRSLRAWEEMRKWQPAGCQGRPFLRTSRDRMFGARELEQGPWVVDLKDLLRRLRG